MHQLFIDFKVYDSVRREVLYNYESYSVLKVTLPGNVPSFTTKIHIEYTHP